MKSKFYCIIFCIAALQQLNAQDYFFVNPAQSLITTNPSFAGSNGFIRHQQLGSASDIEKNMTNSFDAYIKPIKAGIALSVNNNKSFGYRYTGSASLVYAQHFSLLNNTLKLIPSLQFTYMKQRFDDDFFGSTSGPLTKHNFDMAGGLLANYKNLFVGATLYHFNRPDIGFTSSYREPLAISFNASYNLLFSERHLLNFYAREVSQQGSSTLTLGANAVLFRHLVIGAGADFRGQSVVNGSLGFRHNFFSIIASYTSPYYLNDSGMWNVALSFNLRDKEHRRVLTSFETW